MRSKSILGIVVVVGVMLLAGSVSADIFGSGANQFTIDFVNISGDASSANGTYIGEYKPEGFADPTNDYRMGTYEITNDQWDKFQSSYGTVTGSPSNAYDESATYTGTNIPTNNLSWYEGAQFVNYLNTSTGHQAAYKFTGTQGTSDYTFSIWGPGDVGYDASNPYRNSNAYYFMPSEDEWVKAAYWNGTDIQTYATTDGTMPTAGVNTNYPENIEDIAGALLWDVGSGTAELNGTFDMMGNVMEWMESPYESEVNLSGSSRGIRGGSISNIGANLSSSYRMNANYPYNEESYVGFRVASVPEPATIFLLSFGAVMLRKKRVRR